MDDRMDHYSTYQIERTQTKREDYLKRPVRAKAADLIFEKENNEPTIVTQLSPALGYAIISMEMEISEVPPGSKIRKHRHRWQEVVFILKGRGYSLINGTKVDWAEFDSLCIPVWTWHEHINLDEKNIAKLMSFSDAPIMQELALADLEYEDE